MIKGIRFIGVLDFKVSYLNKIKMRILLIILLTVNTFNVHSQILEPEILSTAGEVFQGESMQIDWTIGELAIRTIQNSSLQITQGFHQPNYLMTNIDFLSKELGQINVYPVPTRNGIEINMMLDKQRDVEIQLIDIKGSRLWSKRVKGKQVREEVNLNKLPTGNYFLTFFIDGKRYIQTNKIQKID